MQINYQTPIIPKRPHYRRFAIGDIHGCYAAFCGMLDKIQLVKTDQLFLLGDYINRGESSRKVLDQIISLIHQGYSVYPLRGNHEQMLIDAYRNDKKFLNYFLKKFNSLDLLVENLEEYITFCENLDYYFDIEGFYLSHAGFNFSAENPFTDLRKMYMNMRVKYDERYLADKYLIHGHFTKYRTEIEQSIANKTQKIIGLDNGVYESAEGMGNLCALNLDTFELYFEKNTMI